ncbi:MAG: D-alanine--D-alanine ligase [Planctomycetota bacterium]
MRKLRVLVLLHPDLMPPESPEGYTTKESLPWMSLYDVIQTLRELGHDVSVLGVQWELGPIRDEVTKWKPHVVFNLLEEFYGQVEFDQHVVSYLELLKVPYTGCNPRGLVISRGKAISKTLLKYHRIHSPAFTTVRRGGRVRRTHGLDFPLIVKSLTADASLGISQASIVESDAALKERVRFVHESVQTHALVEQYVEGREIYVGVVGNGRLQVFPPWELLFENLPPGSASIATARVKHDPEYQVKRGIKQQAAEGLEDRMLDLIVRTTKRVFRVLDLNGYARIDYRLGQDGKLYFLEANANPDVGKSEEFACSAEADGLEYDALVQKILNLGLSWSRGR